MHYGPRRLRPRHYAKRGRGGVERGGRGPGRVRSGFPRSHPRRWPRDDGGAEGAGARSLLYRRDQAREAKGWLGPFSFLVQAVELAGGIWSIESEKGVGTKVEFSFPAANVDSPPTGNVPGTIFGLLCLPGKHEMIVRRSGPRGSYELKRSELAEAVGGLERASSLALLKDYLASMEEDE